MESRFGETSKSASKNLLDKWQSGNFNCGSSLIDTSAIEAPRYIKGKKL
jgi:hypothetical protein